MDEWGFISKKGEDFQSNDYIMTYTQLRDTEHTFLGITWFYIEHIERGK